ncbi:carbohydrate esterase family 4 protein [Pelomyxa schiedti]|nr:carbohydrate esterase family 4 protein [Pelomyxa schiedti]
MGGFVVLGLCAVGAAAVVGLFCAYALPKPLVRAVARHYPKVLFYAGPHVVGARRVVGLTIDDAPYGGAQSTAEIAGVLARWGARATWFVIGASAQAHPQALRDLAAAGHELGNHTMHNRSSVKLPEAELHDDVQATSGVIEAALGGGYKVMRVAERLGLRVALGSVYPHDPFLTWARLNAAVLSTAEPGDVVIVHDRPWTAAMLDIALRGWEARGIRAVTLSELVHAS